jgi:hypothetical protein
MTDDQMKEILGKYPMMSYIVYGGNDYLGIIQNVDDQITTIYDFGVLRTEPQKVMFLELAEAWWWESNRLVPINVFLKTEWSPFRPTLKTLNSKDVEIKFGPHISLKEMALKRSKRRSITLVRRVT